MTEGMTSRNNPHADPERWAPRLARLLDEQVAVYAELDGLSVQQGACIDAEDGDALLVVLARRQGLIERLEKLNQEVEPFRREWARLGPSLAAPQRDGLRARFEAIGKLVASITARDEADRRRLEADRLRLAGAIEHAGRARGAVGAYAAPAGGVGPVFQDLKG